MCKRSVRIYASALTRKVEDGQGQRNFTILVQITSCLIAESQLFSSMYNLSFCNFSYFFHFGFEERILIVLVTDHCFPFTFVNMHIDAIYSDFTAVNIEIKIENEFL